MGNDASSARPAYKVEELLALRTSASESRVSLEKFPDEDVIKEHVIKKTPSTTTVGPAISVENVPPLQSLPFPGPGIGSGFRQPSMMAQATMVKRPSPTPSMKRSRAERLIKEHGSPPHVRVTAGGRIVPNDLPQLGSPRFPPTTPSGGHRSPMPSNRVQAFPNGYLAYDPFGKLIQWFDGRWHDVRIDRYTGQPMYHMPVPNLPFPAANALFNAAATPMVAPTYPYGLGVPRSLPPSSTLQPVQPVPNGGPNHVPEDIDAEITVSKNQYERLRQEKIELERHEVKTSDNMTPAQRQDIVGEKRKYVMMLDAIRKRIKELEGMKNGTSTPGPSSAGISSFPTPIYGMGALDGAITAFGAAAPPMPAIPSSFGTMPWPTFHPANVRAASAGKDKPQSTEHPTSSPASEQSPSSRAQLLNIKRSRAIQIRNPSTGLPVDPHGDDEGPGSDGNNGGLNPTSPSYEPGKPYPLTDASPPHFVVPNPTPIETPNPPPAELAEHWAFQQSERTMQVTTSISQDIRGMPTHSSDPQAHRSSTEDNHDQASSVTTTDFFPTNTHEHSYSKYMSRKVSGPARLSIEGNPSTPMRDQPSGVVSPMTDNYHHPPAPPVSPAGYPPHVLANSPEDMRLSSFLRDTARASKPTAQIPQHSPVKAETRDEFHGKSKPYLEGYLAGSSGHAPVDPKNQEYCSGYIDGLSKTCLGPTRESSTVSLKSESISVTRTPPNTTENRSLIADLAGTQPSRTENIRLTQSLTFSSPPPGDNHSANPPPSNYNSGAANHNPSTSFPQATNSRAPSGAFNFANQTHFPRSWSEDNSGVSPPKSAFLQNNGTWHVPAHTPKVVHNDVPLAAAQSAVPVGSGNYSVSRRLVSTSVTSQPSLTGYSGNQSQARVASVPHHEVFGSDKYVVTNSSAAMAPRNMSGTFQMRGQHDGQQSVSTVSRGSQYDGALDDMAELAASVPSATTTQPDPMKTQQHVKQSSSQTTGYPVRSSQPSSAGVTHGSALKSPATATPPASPSKSNASPKKFSSPRRLASRIGEKISGVMDRGTSYCGNERDGGRSGASTAGPASAVGSQDPKPMTSRPESPDPQRMGPEEKKRWREGWRTKLAAAKKAEDEVVRKWRKEGGGSGGASAGRPQQ